MSQEGHRIGTGAPLFGRGKISRALQCKNASQGCALIKYGPLAKKIQGALQVRPRRLSSCGPCPTVSRVVAPWSAFRGGGTFVIWERRLHMAAESSDGSRIQTMTVQPMNLNSNLNLV